MIESGVPGYVVADLHRRGGAGRHAAGDRRASSTPRSTPACRRRRWSAALRRLSVESVPASPQEFGAFLAKERDKWREVVRLSGIKIE